MARYMENLKEMLCDELDKITKEGKLTATNLDVIDKLTHSIKSIATITAMDDSGYSGEGSYRGSYRGEFEGATGPYAGDGGSYRRGRSATTGRYISRASGRSYSMDYSRDGMREKLEELMEEAPDEKTRQELQRLVDKM